MDTKVGNVSKVMPGGRSQDTRYQQLSGHIPKLLVREFKVAIAQGDTTISEAMEQAVMLWLETFNAGLPLPETQERVDKRRTDDQKG